MAGSLGVVWVVGSVVYVALEARMAEVGNEITRRYQTHRMSAGLYQKAFGDDAVMPERYFRPIR